MTTMAPEAPTKTDDKEKQMELPLDATDQVVDTAATDKLQAESCGCRLRLSRLGSHKGFDEATKQDISLATGLNTAAISGGKKLYDPKHHLIKEANEVLGRISSYWMSLTLPLAQAGTMDLKIEGGTRLLRRDKIQTFHEQMIAFQSELQIVVANMNKGRADILQASRDMIGDSKFDENDYPSEFTMDMSWGFPSIEVPSYLAELAPEVYAQEREALTTRIDASLNLATLEFLREFKAVTSSWVDRLGNVTLVYPPEGSKHEHLHGGEIIVKLQHHHAPADVGENEVKVQIRYRPEEGSRKTKTEWVGPMSPTEYADLRPSVDANKRKAFKTSTVDNMVDIIGRFKSLADTFSASDDFRKIVDEAHTHIARFSNTEGLDKELRTSSTYRSDTHSLMQKLSTRLETEVETFNRKRRRVIMDVNVD